MLSSDNPKYGYNAATGQYEDLMAAGIIDPTKVSCDLKSRVWTEMNEWMNDVVVVCYLGGEMLLGACIFCGEDILDVRLRGC